MDRKERARSECKRQEMVRMQGALIDGVIRSLELARWRLEQGRRDEGLGHVKDAGYMLDNLVASVRGPARRPLAEIPAAERRTLPRHALAPW